MQIIKCEMCGGNLNVDTKSEFVICGFCGAKYSKDSIRNKTQAIKSTVETTIGNAEVERLLKDAEVLINFGEIDKAKVKLKKISEDFPSDYRSWYKLAMLEIEANFPMDNSHKTADIFEIRKNNPELSLIDVVNIRHDRMNKEATIFPSTIPVSEYEKKCCIINPKCKVDFDTIRDNYSKEYKVYLEKLMNMIFENSEKGLPVFNLIGLAGNEYKHVSGGAFRKSGGFVYHKMPDEPLFAQVSIETFYEETIKKAITFNKLISQSINKLINLFDIAVDIQIPAYVPCDDGNLIINNNKYIRDETVVKFEDGNTFVFDPHSSAYQGDEYIKIDSPQITSVHMLTKIEAILKCKLKTIGGNHSSYLYIKFNKPYEINELAKYVMKSTQEEILIGRKKKGLCPICGGIVNKYCVCTQCDTIQDYDAMCSTLLSTCRRFKDRANILWNIKSFSDQKTNKSGLIFTNKTTIDYLKPNYKSIEFTVNAAGYASYYVIRDNNVVNFVKFVERREKLQRDCVCQYCGGEFKGLILKKCSHCGKRKDY